jgi:arylsulfatase A-like enzyme
LTDLFPTLVEIAGGRVADYARLDGHSLRPFLTRPEAMQWDGPAGVISMVYAGEESRRKLSDEDQRNSAKQHWSIRTARCRYVLYNNGTEELYDHDVDPHEWTNLAGQPAYARTQAELRQQLPAAAVFRPAERAAGSGAKAKRLQRRSRTGNQ